MRDYKDSRVTDPQRGSRVAGFIGLILLVALISWMSNRDDAQAREIARLSETCPSAQSGQTLVATVRDLPDRAAAKPGKLSCLYAAANGYGRASSRTGSKQ